MSEPSQQAAIARSRLADYLEVWIGDHGEQIVQDAIDASQPPASPASGTVWTDTYPTTEGWYWWRSPHVYPDDPPMVLRYDITPNEIPTRGQWAGPIAPPREATP